MVHKKEPAKGIWCVTFGGPTLWSTEWKKTRMQNQCAGDRALKVSFSSTREAFHESNFSRYRFCRTGYGRRHRTSRGKVRRRLRGNELAAGSPLARGRAWLFRQIRLGIPGGIFAQRHLTGDRPQFR